MPRRSAWQAEGTVRLADGTSSRWSAATAAGVPTLNAWTQLAVVVDPVAGTVTLYVNNTVAATTTVGVNAFNNQATGQLYIGNQNGVGGLAFNQAWCIAVAIAADLLAWLRLLALEHHQKLTKATPDTLRDLLHVPARLVRHARRRLLRLPTDHPHAGDLTHAWQKIRALPI